MATPIPVRALRPLSRRCLVDRPTIRAFSSTKPQPQKKLRPDAESFEAGLDDMIAQAPQTYYSQAAAQSRNLTDDIGILNGSFVFPKWKNLPPFMSNKGFYWNFLKSRPIGWYSRIQYQWAKKNRPRPSVDFFEGAALKDQAEKLYKKLYESFARGDKTTLRKICVSGIAQKLSERIAARNGLRMDWRLEKFVRTRIVSHRGAPLGVDDWPETGWRQVIVCLETDQVLRVSPANKTSDSPASNTAHLAWKPDGARKAKRSGLAKSEDTWQTKRVTEYLVIQKRMVKGEEDKEWRIWGFTDETTPEKIREEEEWEKNLLAYQAKTHA